MKKSLLPSLVRRSFSVAGFVFFLFSIIHCQLTIAQNPLVKQWDKTFGGTSSDFPYSLQQTTDGGYILGGYSYSGIGGSKTQPSFGSYDYWIVKTDSLGNKQWDKTFGGTSSDYLSSLQQTTDGGYILGGYSYSGIGGSKTQPVFGLYDYWIVKTDSLGNKQWDQTFGGTDNDELYSLQQTTDGGYILGGYSLSGIGGSKTQPSFGSADYWIVKIDSLGNKQWDKTYGGTNDEVLYSLQQTTDDGYILGGYSLSGIGGNKTQPSFGNYDYWIVKTDALGNKQWDKTYGGTNDEVLYSLQQTTDDGYILGGYSLSGIGGNKTQPSFGNYDYWIVKTDALGNKQWDKDFGGNAAEDEFGNLSQTSDGGYLIAGTSYSNISGNKSENNLWLEQTWVVKTDSLGNKQWDKTIFTTADDGIGFAIQTKDGCYVVANYTNGGIGGYKTQPSQGGYDYWIIKFCDTTQTVSQACLYHSALAGSDADVTFTLSGGSFQSYGCAPIDPNYWVSGSASNMLMTFTTPQNSPSFRVWGMNDDDSASVMINGSAYPLTASSASYNTKTVCGLSPGPDGVIFVNGKLVGANTNGQGNYSYQDVTINAASVSSVRVSGVSGAGWGFAGVSTCSSSLAPAAHFNSSDTAFCNESGTCIDFTDHSANNPTSWQWFFPGAVPDTSTQQNPTGICYTQPGTYSVKLIVSNSAGSDSLTVSPMITFASGAAPPVLTLSGDTIFCSHASAYQWYFNGLPVSGATDSFYVATADGLYAVQITDSNGCVRLSNGFLVSVKEPGGLDGFKIYPNPVGQLLVIHHLLLRGPCAIDIYNVLGEKVYQSEIMNQKSEINTAGLAKGVYMVEVKNRAGVYRAKFVKQ